MTAIGEPPEEDRSGDPPSLPGTTAVLAASLDALRTTPVALAVLLVTAPFIAAIPAGGSVLSLIVQGVVVVLLARSLGATFDPHAGSLGMRLIKGVIAAILAGVAVTVGLVLLVLPGLYLVVRLYLFLPAIMIDDHGPVQALGESWRRTRGNVLTVGAVLVAVSAILLVVGIAALLGFGGGTSDAMEMIRTDRTFPADAVVSFVSGALVASTSTVLYLRAGD